MFNLKHRTKKKSKKPSKLFLKSLKELDYMEKHPEKYKSYSDIKKLKKELLSND